MELFPMPAPQSDPVGRCGEEPFHRLGKGFALSWNVW